MNMDEEMDGLMESEVEEIDEEYEFHACHFFDFTRLELDWEIEEAERWFEVSGDYQPSPFIVKLNLEKLFSTEVVPNASKSKGSSNTKSSSSNLENTGRPGVSSSKKKTQGNSSHMLQDAPLMNTRSTDKPFQPRSSTLMKPTASHLAKQNKLHDHMDSNCLCTRSQRTSTNSSEKSLQSSVGFDNHATKRQKLEMGYLRKMAHLKHHISFLHKSTKKVTIPKEPELETLLRAHRRRSSKNSSASSENEKDSKTWCNFKALQLNRKILQPSSLLQTRKSTTELTQPQMFNLKTMERANHHASTKASKSKNADLRASTGATESKRLSSRGTLKNGKQDALRNSKARSLAHKDPQLSTVDRPIENLPIEQFTALSLGTDCEKNIMSTSDNSTKASYIRYDIISWIELLDVEENTENVPDSFKSEFWERNTKKQYTTVCISWLLGCILLIVSSKAKMQRSHAKPSQCGGHLRMHEASCWSNMNRGLDIR